MSGFAEYDRYDALGLAELVADGEVTAAEVLEEAIQRTEQHNPSLNAVITPMYEHARRDVASALPEGPFSGVPFLLKDLLHAYAGVPMAAGSKALRAYVPDRDSDIVTRFKGAGLITFGKTNVPEFGLVATTEPVHFGPTRNPWDLSRSPGGSSGGSAAAVAAGIVPMASATDGGGSIRIPAGWCGLFGLKPSRGRVLGGPYYGEVWEGAVTDNVISRSVRDAAASLDALTRRGEGDPYVLALNEKPFLSELDTLAGKLRIAFTTKSPIGTPVHPECQRAVQETATLLEGLGHEVEEAEAPVDGMEIARSYFILYFGQVAADLRWVAATVGPRAAKQDIEETTRLVGLLGESLPTGEYVESRRRWNIFARAMAAFHRQYDLYMTPTTAVPPIELGSLDPSPMERLSLKVVNALNAGQAIRASGLPEKLGIENMTPVPFTQLANLTGQPAMTVPLHWTAEGLPCGVHFMAAIGREDLLFGLAGQLEQALPWRDRRPALVK